MRNLLEFALGAHRPPERERAAGDEPPSEVAQRRMNVAKRTMSPPATGALNTQDSTCPLPLKTKYPRVNGGDAPFRRVDIAPYVEG